MEKRKIPVPRDNIEINVGIGEHQSSIYVIEQLGFNISCVYQAVPMNIMLSLADHRMLRKHVSDHRPSRARAGKSQTEAAITSSPGVSLPIALVISSVASSSEG